MYNNRLEALQALRNGETLTNRGNYWTEEELSMLECNRRWPAAADAAITAAQRCQRQPGFETISMRQPAAADAVTNGRPAVATVG